MQICTSQKVRYFEYLGKLGKRLPIGNFSVIGEKLDLYGSPSPGFPVLLAGHIVLRIIKKVLKLVSTDTSKNIMVNLFPKKGI